MVGADGCGWDGGVERWERTRQGMGSSWTGQGRDGYRARGGNGERNKQCGRACGARASRVYKVWSLKDYTFLYQMAEQTIEEIKIRPALLL